MFRAVCEMKCSGTPVDEARRTMIVLRYTCHFVICIEHFHDPDEANKHTESKIKILSTIYIFSFAGLAE